MIRRLRDFFYNVFAMKKLKRNRKYRQNHATLPFRPQNSEAKQKPVNFSCFCGSADLTKMDFQIRKATKDDCPEIIRLIQVLRIFFKAHVF